jgi:hypothetical protein
MVTYTRKCIKSLPEQKRREKPTRNCTLSCWCEDEFTGKFLGIVYDATNPDLERF